MEAFHKEILNEYLEYLKNSGRSFKNHRHVLKKYFEYTVQNNLEYRCITIRDAQNYQEHLSTRQKENGKGLYNRTTVMSSIGRITSFYTYLRKRGIVALNPFDEMIKLKRERSLPRNIFDEEKMGNFLNSLKDFTKRNTLSEKRRIYKAHVIAELMYSTGARINEVTSLTPSDIDFNRGLVCLRDSKTRKERKGILNSFALSVLKIYVEEMRELSFSPKVFRSDLLFGADSSLVIWINDVLNCESGKLSYGRFSSHNFRHAAGAHLLKNGCDIRYIQEFLGHASLKTTQVYTKVIKEDLRAVLDKYHPRKLRKGSL